MPLLILSLIEIRCLISFGTRSQPSTFPTLFQKKKKSALKKTRREDYVRKVNMKKKVLPPPPLIASPLSPLFLCLFCNKLDINVFLHLCVFAIAYRNIHECCL